jgi:hypothetical protein
VEGDRNSKGSGASAVQDVRVTNLQEDRARHLTDFIINSNKINIRFAEISSMKISEITALSIVEYHVLVKSYEAKIQEDEKIREKYARRK